jgi:predicted chitinase
MDMNLGHTQKIIARSRLEGLLRNQVAYVLATALWETNHTMQPVVEAYWLSEAWRNRNLHYYPWHGRGFVQLTWERNYAKASDETGADLIAAPEAALDPDLAAHILVVGSRDGWFTGKKLSDYITLQRSDFKGARRVINGTDKSAKIAAIARRYDKALNAIGYGEGQPTPPKVDNTAPAGFISALLAFFASFMKGRP